MADPRHEEQSPDLGSLALLYDAIKREIDYVRSDVSHIRREMHERTDSLSKDIRTVQTGVTHLSERIQTVEEADHDADVARAVRASLRRRSAALALGSATFASSVAAVVAVFVH